jgi:hypothetical protein
VKKRFLLAATAALLFGAPPAFSIPVTYLVEGHITGYREEVSFWPEGVDLPVDLLIGSPLTGAITYDPDLADPFAEPSYARWLPTIKYEFYFGEFKFFSGPTPPPVSYLNVQENGFYLYDEVPRYNEVESSPVTYFGPEHLWFNSLDYSGALLSELPEKLPFTNINDFHVFLIFAPGNHSLSIDAEFRVIEVPEPAPFGLFAFGSLLIFVGFRFMRRK